MGLKNRDHNNMVKLERAIDPPFELVKKIYYITDEFHKEQKKIKEHRRQCALRQIDIKSKPKNDDDDDSSQLEDSNPILQQQDPLVREAKNVLKKHLATP